MLAFLIAKHSIFRVFEVNLAPFSLIFMSNPLFKCFFVEMEENERRIKQIG